MASAFRADGERAPHHAAEAEKWLNDPKFFSGIEGAVPQMAFTSPHDFEFRSPVASRWAENDRVFGKLFRAGPDWQKRPSVILLHGWNAELQYRWQFPFLARQLTGAGVNAAMFQLPYHGRRRPREPGAIQNFISYDLLHMLEATRQALADTRALLAWLAEQGSPSVGLWGVSLGAWLAGLLISAGRTPPVGGTEVSAARTELLAPHAGPSYEPEIKRTASPLTPALSPLRGEGDETQPGSPLGGPQFAVLLTPVANVQQAIEELAFCQSIRCSLQSTSSGVLDRLNLASHALGIPAKNVLIVESRYDMFAPVETVENLWQAWGQPEILRLPHGHISVLFSPMVMRRTVKWIGGVNE